MDRGYFINMTINKILHTYWGGEKLSYLRYLTIISFIKYNPDWEVKLYIPAKLFKGNNTWSTKEQDGIYTGKDYLNELPITPIKISMESIGMSDDIPEVHKSDILRYFLLLSYGGVWSDMDILYTKPLVIDDSINHIVCKHPTHDYYSIGLIGGVKGSGLFKLLLDRSFDIRTKGYQSFGNQIWCNLNLVKGTWNIPMWLVYYLDSTKIPDIFEKNIKLPEESIGLHWYGGHKLAGEWENKVTPNNYEFDTTLGTVLKQILKDTQNEIL